MYKKIYLEITNNCNLKCPFCIQNERETKYLEFDNFKFILKKLEKHTKYLYFHILGEPLMHPKLNEFINYASNKFYINITTNGYLIDRIKFNKNIRQINISLHSFSEYYNISIESYLNNIFNSVDVLKKYTYISYRLWVKNKYTKKIINILSEKYQKNIDLENNKNIKLDDNIFLNVSSEFIWPDLNNNYYLDNGKCYALKEHIGILVDGTVVPCCLDSKGIIKLGNIYKDEIDAIKESKRYKDMLNGFKNNKKIELLCKKCRYLKVD